MDEKLIHRLRLDASRTERFQPAEIDGLVDDARKALADAELLLAQGSLLPPPLSYLVGLLHAVVQLAEARLPRQKRTCADCRFWWIKRFPARDGGGQPVDVPLCCVEPQTVTAHESLRPACSRWEEK